MEKISRKVAKPRITGWSQLGKGGVCLCPHPKGRGQWGKINIYGHLMNIWHVFWARKMLAVRPAHEKAGYLDRLGYLPTQLLLFIDIFLNLEGLYFYRLVDLLVCMYAFTFLSPINIECPTQCSLKSVLFIVSKPDETCNHVNISR